MKAYYCTCLVKTGVQIYMALTILTSVVVLALVLQEPILSSTVAFLSVAVNDPDSSFMDLDFDLLKRSVLVVVSIFVASSNVLACGAVLVGVWARRHQWLWPWMVIGLLEMVGLLAIGTYELYLLWETKGGYEYQVDRSSHSSSSLAIVLAVPSSLTFGELFIYTVLAAGGILLYLAFLLYAWIMVKVQHDQMRERCTETAFVMKIVKQM